MRRRALGARHVHRAGIHHHRPRRQPDHRVPPGGDERVAREPRRRRRGDRARHRGARRPRRDARARRAVRGRADPVRVRSGPGAAAFLRRRVDGDDRRGELRRRQRLRGAAPRRADGAQPRRDRVARRRIDRHAGWRRIAHPRRRAHDRVARGEARRRSSIPRVAAMPIARDSSTESRTAGSGSAPGDSPRRSAPSRSQAAAARTIGSTATRSRSDTTRRSAPIHGERVGRRAPAVPPSNADYGAHHALRARRHPSRRRSRDDGVRVPVDRAARGNGR